MPREGELTYYQSIGESGRAHSINKPFSDPKCGALLMEAGAILSLLPPPPAKVLECGCGTGWLTYFLAKRGYDAVGQDVAEYAIHLAKENPTFRESPAPEFIISDFEKLGRDAQFDAVVFFAALHHTLDPQKVFDSAWRVLKPGGVLIASEPGLGHQKRSAKVLEEYDVTDIDMPPVKSIMHGKKAGFTKFRIHQHADQICSVLYDNNPGGSLKRLAWKVPGLKYAALIFSLLFYKRYNGIIWMQKA
jgi:SAM-dependent methyltransferase